MSKDEKIRKFWIRGPDQYKKNDRGRSVYMGRGQPITFVAWRHIGDDYVEYARATLNPTPNKKTGKPDEFNRKRAHDEATYRLMYEGRGETYRVKLTPDTDVQVCIVADIACYGREGTVYNEAARAWLYRYAENRKGKANT